jgi:hypothetical protein
MPEPSPGTSALALRASVVATAIAIAVNARFGVGDVLCEALLLLTSGLWLSRRPVVRASVSAMPKPHRFLVFGLLGLMVAGQLVNESRATFPFPGWGMYTRTGQERSTVESYRLVAIDAQGGSRKLDLLTVYGALGGHAGYTLRSLFRKRDPEAAAEVGALRAELIRWIAARYNEQAHEQPAREIQVLRLQTVIHPSPGQASQTTEIVGRFDVEGDG